MCVFKYSLVCMIFFFFSSRRRHTRYWRDWSSDVCSSDLEHGNLPGRVQGVDRRRPVAKVDLDGVVLDLLLGEDDSHTRAVGTARGVVQLHGSSPMTCARRSYSSGAGGSSTGDAALRANCRTSSLSAPVSRATSVGFAASASSS